MDQLVKVYTNSGWSNASKKFARDAAKLARDGWLVQSQSALNFGIVHKINVVYTRESKEATQVPKEAEQTFKKLSLRERMTLKSEELKAARVSKEVIATQIEERKRKPAGMGW